MPLAKGGTDCLQAEVCREPGETAGSCFLQVQGSEVITCGVGSQSCNPAVKAGQAFLCSSYFCVGNALLNLYIYTLSLN